MKKFSNVQELIDYTETLENRIKILETLSQEQKNKSNTWIISNNFYKRAFAIWLHWFTANILLGIIFTTIYILTSIIFFGAVISFLPKILK